jgi:hypothetical protein
MRVAGVLANLFVVLMIVRYISPLSAEDRGPMFAFSYCPSGAGGLFLSGPSGSYGGDSTKPDTGSPYSSAKRLYVSTGYYYNFLQADISYLHLRVNNQKSDYRTTEGLLDGSDSSVTVRAGKRFSVPGDTSYTWLYLGLKRYGYNSSLRDVNLTAYGYLAGYSGFYSFGLSHDMEFVITLDAYLGTYRFEKISTGSDYQDITKRFSVSFGGGVGVGVQYEPYNMSLLLKVSYDYNRVAYNARYAGGSRRFSAGAQGYCFGIEARYVMPSVEYNEREQ